MTAIIFDLDNTLYNWIDTIVPAINDMIDEASRLTRIPTPVLIRDIHKVNVKKGSIEHPYALLEADCIVEYLGAASRDEAKAALDPAFHAFNRRRKYNLKLYKGAEDLLDYAVAAQCRLIAFSEAKVEAVADRVARLGLDDYFDTIYCVRSLGFNDDHLVEDKFFSRLRGVRFELLDSQLRKPDPEALNVILRKEGLVAESTWYVGDSLVRDVGMAIDAGLTAVWAKYGIDHDPENMELLLRITHWTEEEVGRMKRVAQERDIEPDLILDESPLQLIDEMCRSGFVHDSIRRLSGSST